MKFLIQRFILISSLALASSLCFAQPSTPSSFGGFDTTAIGIDQKLDNQLPLDTKFTDENGKAVTLREFFKGRPVIINPIFYKCEGTCVLTLNGLITSINRMKEDRIGEQFDIITFSIRPTETSADAMARKKQVLALYDPKGKPGNLEMANANWHYLTGSMESIVALTSAIGFRYTYSPKVDKINHATGIMITTPEGKISRYLFGTEYPAKLLLTSVKDAQLERISVPSEPILLGCFQFDPATNRYRIVMWRAVQVGGALTLIILGASIAIMSLGGKKGNKVKKEKDIS